jgi:hypothetical protein
MEHLRKAMDVFVKIGDKYGILGKTKEELMQIQV